MNEPDIKKNLVLSTMYQILIIITPFITAPYISRVLGSSIVGIYSYTYSIEMYFSMFAALGTVNYGTREIARNRKNKKKLSQLFWEIELLTVFTTLICLIGWGILVIISKEYKIYFAILTCYLFATLLDISWFYTGIEQFKYIVSQNALFKIIGVIFIFLFVKSSQDFAKYIAIMALSTLLGNLSMWIYLPKFLKKVDWKTLHIFSHLRETLIYFIPTAATSIYTVLDKTLIGLITQNTSQNGYYEQATKVINMAKAVTFSSLNSIFGARISFLFSEKKYNEIRSKIKQSIDYILFMGIGICFGIIGVSARFVPCFFGEGYNEVIILLQMLSPIVVIIGISNCLGTQYYTPAGLRSLSAKFVIVGAVLNLILNLILIPNFSARGAVIASIFAESAITILYLKYCSSYMSINYIIKLIWKKLIAGVVMLVLIQCIDKIIVSNLAAVVVEFCIGVFTYTICLVILKDTFIRKFLLKKLVKKRGYNLK